MSRVLRRINIQKIWRRRCKIVYLSGEFVKCYAVHQDFWVLNTHTCRSPLHHTLPLPSIFRSGSIAAQLHDAKIAMELQIREELEAELTAQQEEDDSRSISDLENALRRQLSQAKSEQEDLLMKVRDSQQQFQAVREGFKSALVQ